MHNIYAVTHNVLIIAVVLYIVALQFCNGKTIPITDAYERTQISIAQNATVARIVVGIEYFNFMNMLKKHNVLETLTTDTFAHAQQQIDICISLFGVRQAHPFQKHASGLDQDMNHIIYVLLCLRKCASNTHINNRSHFSKRKKLTFFF